MTGMSRNRTGATRFFGKGRRGSGVGVRGLMILDVRGIGYCFCVKVS